MRRFRQRRRVRGLCRPDAGAAGSLYAHYTRIIAPEMFHLFETVTSLLMVVSGGLGSIAGVIVTPAQQLMIHDIAGRQHLQSAVRLMSMSLPGSA